MAEENQSSLATRTTAPMLFCENCANLLYPECSSERSMLWRCNYCKTTEIHDDCKLVYVLNLKMKSDTAGEMALLAEFASDPTAQRDPEKRCPECKGHDVTCFVNPLGQQQEDMTLFFACANRNCRHVWEGKNVA
ncbi:DNA-directed RNA polymerase II subunit RPB9 [Strigomonas culicis]|uniref:DNA-directed RNA polymerase II subunit RPB9 n=1 Tax=Strigomonas culicis TaxID=28005 RepID=S9V2C5_9TRYP|nr:DNA-directed RNA polymerase II subunit RPB9 [Strigomonas culicis]|eukprot:EPY35098.1 DNA-directed RNA polymerase II subunit RPB9 [Strigomonas culicis]